ncbi:DMT family transporter [Nonomuraea soli]|uniref:Drug/metabolite transporter (DMT)-like permease n=1 Tax=Nonomuraea soli TaxID=1032476 RepID=A0A7W0CV36_9ACTN|nr:DMT family transporter [Nonomuraea soli]MBA2897901.1 drug/metabolite transporter (DMT)-like permease [Nonomuraea soli]
MSPLAMSLVLVAAVCHASWNLLSKQASRVDGVVFVWIVAVASTALWAPVGAGYVLVTGDVPAWGDLAVVTVSAALHTAYFVALQRGYLKGDLSVVYPIARGTGPMLASAFAVVVLHERPGLVGGLGIVLVGVGVFLMSGGGRADGPGILFGLLTGLFIAGYTVWDAQVVGAFGVAPLLLTPLGEAGRVALLAPAVLGRRRGMIAGVWREHRWRIMASAVLMPLSYLLVLFAFTMAPVSVVAPAREVSVLIAVLLGGRLLAEGDLRRRLMAAGVILGGVVAIALS